MDLEEWLPRHGGIAHRAQLATAGFSAQRIAKSDVEHIGRRWIAVAGTAPGLVAAARVGGRLACISAARHLELQLLQDDGRTHLALHPHRGVLPPPTIRVHRSLPIVEVGRFALVESVPDLLAHVAACLPHAEALVVWESALRRGRLTAHELRTLPWRTAASRRLAAEAASQSDSLLETLLAHALRLAGLPFAQQVPLGGRPVDFLVAGRVVVQVDGYAFHSDAGQRRRDIGHDAWLRLAGFEAVRFAYQDVVERIEHVVHTIRRLVSIARVPLAG